MAHVTALAKHILTLEPDKDAARLCFYHYLKNLCESSEPVNVELINRFFCRALTFTHWQENSARLFQETMATLAHFQESTRQELPLQGVLDSDTLQAVPVGSLRNLERAIQRNLERASSPFDQFRVLPEGEDRVVAITLQGDRSLRITVYPKVLAILEGELVPLCHDFTLFYSPSLQLHPGFIQQLEVGPHTSARFYMGPQGITGTISRGYTFQKYSAMDGGGLHQHPVLFYPLKRLEQFFVNRKTDPMYIELTGLLEKALDLLNGDHPDAFKFASAALERGRLALEHIFPDDKLARLLINNLEKSLALAATRRPGEAAPLLKEPSDLGVDFLGTSPGARGKTVAGHTTELNQPFTLPPPKGIG